MKKVLTILLVLLCVFAVCGCNTTSHPDTPTIQPTETASNVNYLQTTKNEVHDMLFEIKTAETEKVVEKIFKHLEYEVLTAQVDGDEAYMTMAITNVNCGQAWFQAASDYAKLCLENAFTENYLDEKELYNKYLDNVEKAIKNADYVSCVVEVEMEMIDHRWVCELTDELVNGMTGGLLSAIDGEGPIMINSNLLFTANEYPIELSGFQKKENDIYFTLKWTNNSNIAKSYEDVIWTGAYQKDYKLATKKPSVKDKNNNELWNNRNKDINPGETIEILEVFHLNNQTDTIKLKTYNFITNDLLFSYNLTM